MAEIELSEVAAANADVGGPTYSEGLSSPEAERRLRLDGRNVLDVADKVSFISILLTQARSTIFLLTSVAAIISWFTGSATKAYILMGVVGFVCLANTIGEYTSQDAGAALASKASDRTRVVRDGSEAFIEAPEIVVGDVVVLGIGDIVPADILVLESIDLQTMEAVLTGEPHECSKSVELKDPSAPFASNMLYCMTDIVAGRGRGEVVATGMRTQVGLIAKRLQSSKKTKLLSPLQMSINMLGRAIACIVLCAVLLATIIAYASDYQNPQRPCRHGDNWCLFVACLLRGVIMSVALIPHGLPFVVMVMLNIGAKEMGKRNAKVSKVTAVDYLAATTVICTDKTGTLTEGKMTAQRLFGLCREDDGDAKDCNISFYPLKGLHPNGGIFKDEDLDMQSKQTINQNFEKTSTRQAFSQPGAPDIGLQLREANNNDFHSQMLRAHLGCAFLHCHGTRLSQPDSSDEWTVAGNMTEAAIKVAAAKGGFWDDGQALDLWRRHELVPELEVPFSSKRKMAASIHKIPEQLQLETLQFNADVNSIAIVKGAPDRIIPRLASTFQWRENQIIASSESISSDELDTIRRKNSDYADEALRTLLLAVRPLSTEDCERLRRCETGGERLALLLEKDLFFLSLWGIVDPPRAEVPPSVSECHEAGIRVVMITGDQLPTATAIGQQVGVLPDGSHETSSAICTELHERQSPIPVARRRLSVRASQLLDISNEQRASLKEGCRASPPYFSNNAADISASRSFSVQMKATGSKRLSVHDERSPDQHEPVYRCEEELEALTRQVNVWARAQPTDKVAIVDSLMAQGHIAAMTGDGVNDAPALTKANVGVSMGISGTAVTQNAADLILIDDNFATIVAAIREGRRIYMNAQKYTTCNMSVKAGECVSMLAAIAAGLPLPILPLQQIANLLVTHIICTLPFAWEAPELYVMKVPPRNTKSDLVVPWVMWKYRWFPYIVAQPMIVLGILCLGTWAHTGYIFTRDLIGTSYPSKLDTGKHACTFAGTMSKKHKIFQRDHAPYKCRCRLFSVGDSIGEPRFVEHYGNTLDYWKVHAPKKLTKHDIKKARERPMDYTWILESTIFNRSYTPWVEGKLRDPLEDCQDNTGLNHKCWNEKWGQLPENQRPVLPADQNCAAYGTQIGQSMTYATIQLGEILTVLSFRRDSFCLRSPFSNGRYNVAFCFNLGMLYVFMYVTPVRQTLSLQPLGLTEFAASAVFALALLGLSELFKVPYRRAKENENIQLQKEAWYRSIGRKDPRGSATAMTAPPTPSMTFNLRNMWAKMHLPHSAGAEPEVLRRCLILENEVESLRGTVRTQLLEQTAKQERLEARMLALEQSRC